MPPGTAPGPVPSPGPALRPAFPGAGAENCTPPPPGTAAETPLGFETLPEFPPFAVQLCPFGIPPFEMPPLDPNVGAKDLDTTPVVEGWYWAGGAPAPPPLLPAQLPPVELLASLYALPLPLPLPCLPCTSPCWLLPLLLLIGQLLPAWPLLLISPLLALMLLTPLPLLLLLPLLTIGKGANRSRGDPPTEPPLPGKEGILSRLGPIIDDCNTHRARRKNETHTQKKVGRQAGVGGVTHSHTAHHRHCKQKAFESSLVLVLPNAIFGRGATVQIRNALRRTDEFNRRPKQDTRVEERTAKLVHEHSLKNRRCPSAPLGVRCYCRQHQEGNQSRGAPDRTDD